MSAANTLTRAAQVREVLEAGGFVISLAPASGVGFGICELFDAASTPVPAWQTAITSNLTKLRTSFEVSAAGGTAKRWELRR